MNVNFRVFNNENEFSQYIEELKVSRGHDTIIEAISDYYENDTDQDMSSIIKMLNKRILEQIEIEARDGNMLKVKEEVITL